MNQRVFIDSSAYFAANDPRDDNHAAAVATARRLVQDRAQIYTTNFIIAETHTLLLTRRNRDVAAQVLARLDASDTRIVRATEADERRAREIIRQYVDKDFSLIDTISFAVMERLHLRLAWTYHAHFAQFGFTPVEWRYAVDNLYHAPKPSASSARKPPEYAGMDELASREHERSGRCRRNGKVMHH